MTTLNKISSFGLIFLFTTLILIYPVKIVNSYGEKHFISDKSSIIKTTDCINSMITSVFMGSNADCSNNNNSKKLNFASNSIHSSLSKNDPLNFGSQNNNTSDFLAMNNGLVKGGSSPSLDDPSIFTKSLQQDQGLSLGNTSSLHPTDGKTKGDPSPYTNNVIGNLLDKNKHGKEIFACFNRAIVSTNYLSDSAIIKCAKDHNSFK